MNNLVRAALGALPLIARGDRLPEKTLTVDDVVIDRSDVAAYAAVTGLRYGDTVALTYPFVLSWLMLEAMSAGALVIGSRTPPVEELIEDGVNGRLLPFFDVAALSETLIGACRNPGASASLRAAARATAVEKFSSVAGQAAWLALLGELGVEFSAA